MRLIIIHKGNQAIHSRDNSLLRQALSSSPAAGTILEGMANWHWPGGNHRNSIVAYPGDWSCENFAEEDRIIPYMDNEPASLQTLLKTGREKWLCIFNGRFAIKIAPQLLKKMLSALQSDFITVNVSRDLQAYNEKARITSQGLIGFRRLYYDSFEPEPVPDDWPHCIFIRAAALDQVSYNAILTGNFPDFLAGCKSASLRTASVKMGGEILDLDTANGLLDFCSVILGSSASVHQNGSGKKIVPETRLFNYAAVPDNPLLFGRVLLGKNVQIDPRAVIAGPTIIGDGVRIEGETVITSSIIGSNVSIPAGQYIQNRILTKYESNHLNIPDSAKACDCKKSLPQHIQQIKRHNNITGSKPGNETFRIWPRFSYARFFKRIADIIAAGIALLLFAPFFPVIAAAIKLSSKGPVFYKDKRQGLHGREFNCIKFRTMVVGADDMQDKLRVLNKVDGPQFKMDDDPRVNSVGRFMRATYFDEVPQFINVLLGQMSVIGPRPSPEAENELCPFWHYARLSVRPGITGLWQVFGTREPLKDFQEWIHYDVKYIRELSLRLDLWLCCRTASKIIKLFVNQL